MAYSYEGDLIFGILAALTASVPSLVVGIAAYVLSALGIYTISRRRELRRPWLAWVPVVNAWLLGSLSDQYRYVVNRENRAKRKLLLVLGILKQVLTAALTVLGIQAVSAVMLGGYRHSSQLWSGIWGPVASMIGLGLPLAGVVIAYTVIRFMALYDVYRSLDPANAVIFLVLSVLFRPLEPFFLFFNRDQEKGMPPRRQTYTDVPPVDTVYESTWESENRTID